MADRDHAKIRFSWPGVLFEYDGSEAGANAALDEFWKLHAALNPREEFTGTFTLPPAPPEADEAS